MRLLKVLQIISFLTIVSLVYIHLQMRIYDLAYQGLEQEGQIRKLIELNGSLTYTILTFKSANNIGDQMLSENSNMHFRGSQNVVQLETPLELWMDDSKRSSSSNSNRAASLLSFLSFRK